MVRKHPAFTSLFNSWLSFYVFQLSWFVSPFKKITILSLNWNELIFENKTECKTCKKVPLTMNAYHVCVVWACVCTYVCLYVCVHSSFYPKRESSPGNYLVQHIFSFQFFGCFSVEKLKSTDIYILLNFKLSCNFLFLSLETLL